MRAKCRSGGTALHQVVKYKGGLRAAELLRKSGADSLTKDQSGRTPLDIALPEYRDLLSRS